MAGGRRTIPSSVPNSGFGWLIEKVGGAEVQGEDEASGDQDLAVFRLTNFII
jgi:hypothetical protein